MKTKLLLVLLVTTMTMVGQTTKSVDSQNESWYFKVGGSYFMQTAATEFPVVSGQLPNSDVYAADGKTLVSRETNHGSFGEGFRTGLNVGYRFNTRLGVEMGVNYFFGSDKTMVETTNLMVAAGPTFVNASAVGRIHALDLAPAVVLFLGESKGFEPYTKVGVIVPVYGNLTIETNKTFTNPLGTTNAYSKDVVLPNPTIGFMAVLGTSYKLSKNISAYAEVEYRNFTVHGKSKETKEYTENGVDKLHTPTAFRQDASYSAINVDYVDKITSSSNNKTTNPSKFDNNKATQDISSYVGISGLGFSLGVKYSL